MDLIKDMKDSTRLLAGSCWLSEHARSIRRGTGISLGSCMHSGNRCLSSHAATPADIPDVPALAALRIPHAEGSREGIPASTLG